MSAKGIQIFVKKAPWVMALLLQDFPQWGLEDAAAAVGNGGHESDGLQAINEINPTAKGSRGGFGWFQWTASRRREFEAYCQRNGLSPMSDRANYNFLFVELKGGESRAVPRTAQAVGLRAKVEAFELSYERAGIKHYDSREKWAERALTAWASASDAEKTPPWQTGAPVPAPTPRPEPELLTPPQAVHDVIDATPAPAAPEKSSSPVAKAIGAGNGGTVGAAGGMTLGVAIVYLMGLYGWVPEGADGAMFGAAIAAVITGVPGVIGGIIGAYRAKQNAT